MTDNWEARLRPSRQTKGARKGLLEGESEAALRQVSETLGGLDIV